MREGCSNCGKPYNNLLICLELDIPCVGHTTIDFIGFFIEVMGDQGGYSTLHNTWP